MSIREPVVRHTTRSLFHRITQACMTRLPIFFLVSANNQPIPSITTYTILHTDLELWWFYWWVSLNYEYNHNTVSIISPSFLISFGNLIVCKCFVLFGCTIFFKTRGQPFCLVWPTKPATLPCLFSSCLVLFGLKYITPIHAYGCLQHML